MTKEMAFNRWEQWSNKTQTSDMALQSPTAFHCIPLFFHFSIWGLPYRSISDEGAPQSDHGLREPTGAFIVDLLKFS